MPQLLGPTGDTNTLLLMTTLYTVGHGVLAADAVITNLRRHGVELVLDVRSHPASTTAPEFNREQLRDALERAGIDYAWVGRALGGRPPKRLRTRSGAPDYERMASEPNTASALDNVVAAAGARTIALLCSEARPDRCHRSRMLEPELELRGATVEHILPDGSLTARPTLFS